MCFENYYIFTCTSECSIKKTVKQFVAYVNILFKWIKYGIYTPVSYKILHMSNIIYYEDWILYIERNDRQRETKY